MLTSSIDGVDWGCQGAIVNVEQYQNQRQQQQIAEKKPRGLCSLCVQPPMGCYCALVKRFNSGISFAILIHPIEVRRRIATGRMSHLCLESSYLISGQNYSQNSLVNKLIEDKQNHCVILYPGADSTNLNLLSAQACKEQFSSDKKMVVFVIDGTWATAKKMMRESENLKTLPKICFTPDRPSAFRVRKQPQEHCYSTIEAIHQTIGLLGEYRGYNSASKAHDNLLEVFSVMVERQLSHLQHSEKVKGAFNSRRESQQKDQA